MATTSASSPAPADAGKQRVLSLDAFRGIAINFVILCHVAAYGWGFQQEPGQQWQFWWSVFLRDLFLPCLPIFLLLSGYLLGNVAIASWAEYRTFLARRVSRIFIPFIFWSIVFLAMSALRTKNYDPADLLLRLVTGRADGPYFFILVMLQLYVCVPLFSYALGKAYGLTLLLIANALYIAGLYMVQLLYWPTMPWEVAKTPMFGWIGVFTVGMYIRRHPHSLDRFTIPGLAIACAALLSGSLAESSFFIPRGYFELGISDLRFSSILYGTAFVLLLLKTVDWNWPAWLATIGVYSFGIFFIHGFIMRRAGGLLAVIPGLYDIQPAFQIALAIVTLLISVAIIAVTRRLLPEWITSRVLAF